MIRGPIGGPGYRRPTSTALALGIVAIATAFFCFDRLMNRSYPLPQPLGVASDVDGYFYPSIVYLKALVERGELPLWNPYQMAGEPFLAVHQSAVTYPLLVGLLWLPANLVLAVHAVLHMFLAGAMTVLFARRLGMATSGAVAAAFCYMFSNIVAGAVFDTAYLSSYVWLPAILWGVYEIADRCSLKGILVLAAATALSFAAGYSQGFVYSVQFAAIYGLALLAVADRRLRVVGSWVLAGVLAGCLSAVQLTATVELAARSVRSLQGLSLREAGLGVTAESLIRGLFQHADLTTVTALMIPASVLGLVLRGTRRHVLFFALAAVVLADFMRGSNGYTFPLYFELPGGDVFRLPLRVVFVYAFCGAMLVAAGQTALLRAVARYPRVAMVLAAVVPIVAGLELYARSEIPVQYTPLTAPQSLDPPSWIADPVNARGQFERMFIERDIPSQVPYKLGQMTSSFVLPDYEPALPMQYQRFFDAPQQALWHGGMYVTPEIVERFSIRATPLRSLDLVSVRFYVDARWSRSSLRDPIAKAVDGRMVFQQLPVPIAERDQALPRAYVVHDVAAVADSEEALRRVQAREFQPRESAVITAAVAPTVAPLEKGAWEYARILEYRPNDVSLEARCQSRCLVILTDLYYPGWRVYVDDRPAEILETNYLVRGVVIEQGVHRLTYSYRPRNLLMAAGVSLCACIAFLCLGVFAFWKRESGHREHLPTAGVADVC